MSLAAQLQRRCDMSQGGTRVSSYEVTVSPRLSEVFNTAVYRFIEARAEGDVAEYVALHTERHGDVDKKSLTLWSQSAADEFARFWQAFPTSGR